jgi:hypothetical protein
LHAAEFGSVEMAVGIDNHVGYWQGGGGVGHYPETQATKQKTRFRGFFFAH